MQPTLKDQLKAWKQDHREVKKEAKKPKKRKAEQLSEWDFKELMGQFNPTMGRRKGGALGYRR